jgi:integrase
MIETRIRVCGRRPRIESAPDRVPTLKAMAQAMTRAAMDPERAELMLSDAAKAEPGELRKIQALVAEIAGRETFEAAAPSAARETFATYADRWFDDRDRRGLTSVDTDRGRITKHVVPKIGTVPIVDVGREELRAVVEHLDDTVRAGALHWNTARKVWGLVTKLFSDAQKGKVAALRVRDDNPARDVRGPDEGETTAKQWLHPDEASALLACEPSADAPGVPLRWRRLYALAMYLYLRPGELAALEWKDVHLAKGYIHVHQALDLRSGLVKSTKTGVSRKVPIHASLAPLLEAMRPKDGGGRVVESEHANRKAEGGMPPLESLAGTLRDHLVRAGVTRSELHEERPTTKRMTFYDLRATGITWEALAGTEPLVIQRRAGHRNFDTTQGYIRTAEEIGVSVGTPFPPLPASLLGGPNGGPGGTGPDPSGAFPSKNPEESRGPVSSGSENELSNPVGDATYAAGRRPGTSGFGSLGSLLRAAKSSTAF